MSVKADNAIILAAGYSSRFAPLCFDIPKGLLPVKGEKLIERQIRQLGAIGIKQIVIVTGAYAEQFAFLQQKYYGKYDIQLVYNSDYAVKNNFASLYAARDFLGNSIISSSDLFFSDNVFQNSADYAYFSSVFVSGATNQRCLTLDAQDKIIATNYGGHDTWITFGGQAFFSSDVSQKLISYIRPVYDNPAYADKYWVDFHDAHLAQIPMYIKRLTAEDIVEFNSLCALRQFDADFRAVAISPVMEFLISELKADELELENFLPIKQGNSAIGCTFTYHGERWQYQHSDRSLKIITL